MGIFSGYNIASKPTGNHSYIEPGRYFAVVEAIKVIEKRNKTEAVAVEIKPIKVIQTYEDPFGEDGRHCIPSPLNCTASHLIQPGNYFDGDIKSLGMALEGMNESEASDPKTGINLEYLEELVSPDQPKVGTIVEVNAMPIVTQRNTPFTRVEFVRSNLPHHPNSIKDSELED